MIFFARNGKPLGRLNFVTDHIELLKSAEFDLTDEEIKKMENGEYIVRKRKECEQS